MDEQNQLHMTIVTRKRRHSPADAADAPEQRQTEASRSGSEHHRSGGEHRHHDGAHHHHEGEHRRSSNSRRSRSGEHRSRRRYKDYGTVNLGELTDAPAEHRQVPAAAAVSPASEPNVMDKYAPILNRKYQKRKHTRLAFAVFVALVVLAITVAAVIIGKKYFSVDESAIETQEPLESIDLEDLVYD